MNNQLLTENPERLRVAIILSMVGGFLDVYTYMFRGEVFANAVSGNLVLCGVHLAQFEWAISINYIYAIVAYGVGIFLAEVIHNQVPNIKFLSWHQRVILLEFLCLIPIPFIPYGVGDNIVTTIISFVCALQVQTFRRVHGLPFASTMCTGNLRSSSEALYNAVFGKKPEEWLKAFKYYTVIFFFAFGAALGVLVLKWLGHYGFFLAPAALFYVLFLIHHSHKK